jgi:hypothetical protein
MEDERWEPGMPVLDRQAARTPSLPPSLQGLPPRSVPEVAPTPLQKHYINLSVIVLIPIAALFFRALTPAERAKARLTDILVQRKEVDGVFEGGGELLCEEDSFRASRHCGVGYSSWVSDLIFLALIFMDSMGSGAAGSV